MLSAALPLIALAGCPAPPPANGPSGGVGGLASAKVETPFTPKPSAIVPVDESDPQRGPATALVTIVMFSDFQCPYCKRVEPTLGKLRETYGDKLRIVWKDDPLPFHAHAMPAALAARALYMNQGNAAFWAMHDRVFEHQVGMTDEAVAGWARELGLTDVAFAASRDAATARINESIALGGKLGVDGTPCFLIDGEVLSGAQPYDKFAGVIDAHLQAAQARLAAGTPRESLYADMVEAYWKAPSARREEPDAPVIADTVWHAEVGSAPVLGPSDAPVTIVVFSDFECTYCQKLEPTLKRLRETYAGKLRFAWKDQPLEFHARALPAAIFAREARKQKGDAGFWAAHDKLFEASPKLEDAALLGLAKELGLDAAKVEKALASSRWKPEVQADLDEAEDLNVRGAPVIFINGRSLTGALPIETFSKVIDEELAKADAKIKGGIAKDKLYAEIIKDGKGGPLTPPAIPAWAPTKGPKNAKVVIQVFADFQCPFCKRAEVQLPLPATDDNPNPGIDPNTGGFGLALKGHEKDVRVVWRNYPLSFHARAVPAAALASEAFAQKGNDGFWKAHDALWASQPKLEDDDLERIARSVGLDWGKAKAAIDGEKFKANFEADKKDGEALGVTGTPAFLIGRHLVVGAQPKAKFDAAIARALAEAK
jgi:protein-disulfide isomerase